MKPIKLTEEMKLSLFDKFFEKFKNELDNYCVSSPESTLAVKTDFSEELKEKIHIIFTPEAYLRMKALVKYFDTEVAWYGLVRKIDDKTYYVYDVKVCKQTVDGAKVDTDPDDALEFFNSLTEEEAQDMLFQAHSHVRMSTTASAIDIQNQMDVIRNMGKTGYYIFQIWNKNGDINTYMYDVDAGLFYDKKDVIIEIEDSLGSLDDFILSVADLVEEKKFTYTQYQKQNYAKMAWEREDEKIKNKEHTYQQGYWDGTSYYEGWD